MYGKYFQYDGELSSSYNLMIAGVEVNDYNFGLSRDVLRGEFNRFRNRPSHMGTKWQNPLTFQISFIKDVCSEPTQRNLVFTEEEVNAINAWLTSPDYPTLFHMYDYDFERDSLNNMILINHDTDTANFTIYAEGYYPATYYIQGDHCRVLVDETDPTIQDGDLLPPPKPRVQWHDGYFSLQYYMDSYPSKVTDIYCNDGYADGELEIWGDTDDMIMEVKEGVLSIYAIQPYKRIETDEWLSSYDVLRNMPIYTTDDYQMSYPISTVYPHDSHYDGTYTVLLNRVKTLNVKYDYFGVFTEITPQLAGGNVIGFNATFICDSPFAWTQEYTQYLDTTTGNVLEFNCSTAERYREVYPVIKVHVPEDGDTENKRASVEFVCVNDEMILSMKLLKGATTTIDCEHCIITYTLDSSKNGYVHYDNIGEAVSAVMKSNGVSIHDNTVRLNAYVGEGDEPIEIDNLHKLDWDDVVIKDMSVDGARLKLTLCRIKEDNTDEEDIVVEAGYSDTVHFFWPRLYYGKNTFYVLGKCTALFQYREPRKVGDW